MNAGRDPNTPCNQSCTLAVEENISICRHMKTVDGGSISQFYLGKDSCVGCSEASLELNKRNLSKNANIKES